MAGRPRKFAGGRGWPAGRTDDRGKERERESEDRGGRSRSGGGQLRSFARDRPTDRPRELETSPPPPPARRQPLSFSKNEGFLPKVGEGKEKEGESEQEPLPRTQGVRAVDSFSRRPPDVHHRERNGEEREDRQRRLKIIGGERSSHVSCCV